MCQLTILVCIQGFSCVMSLSTISLKPNFISNHLNIQMYDTWKKYCQTDYSLFQTETVCQQSYLRYLNTERLEQYICNTTFGKIPPP